MRHSDDWLDELDGGRARGRPLSPGDAFGDLAGAVASGLGERIREQPGTFAGIVTFVAIFALVGSNALFHQPHSHTNAFYSTRDHAAPVLTPEETAAVVKRGIIAARQKAEDEQVSVDGLLAGTGPSAEPIPAGTPNPAAADPTVLGVQATLKQLRLYDGAVDGLMGSRTRQAIIAYQAALKLKPTGEIDAELLSHLRSVPPAPAIAAVTDSAVQLPDGDVVASIRPTPRPDPADVIDAQPEIAAAPKPRPADAASPEAVEMIRTVQAALRQFNRPDLDIDGKLGPKTREAITEFQDIVQLPKTGDVDARLLKALRDKELIN
ncbi:MAG: peptidoglycan-binding protein [Rhizobiaceae bacterium]|nr:peptidoglycan-binding protein [Rhizobiaceae bacterium]